jgi:hypothetical protein
MTCRVGVGFVFHSPSMSLPVIGGYAICLRCEQFVDLETFTRDRCPGSPPQVPAPSPVAPFQSGPASPFRGVPCALCGDPVLVDPMHRATVEWFGTTCAACFGLEAVHG